MQVDEDLHRLHMSEIRKYEWEIKFFDKYVVQLRFNIIIVIFLLFVIILSFY